MQSLPAATIPFTSKKAKILSQLAVPTASYTDASPKGSVDEGIRDFIDEINAAPGLVTTSSCAGRVSVFLEGRKTAEEDGGQVATPGGKGAGGRWLFVSHDPVKEGDETWMKGLEMNDEGQDEITGGKEKRLIHFKFEPMILHILTTSPHHAQLVLRCALQAGFRESGAIELTPAANTTDPATPMVGIRSMGLGFESLLGYEVDGQRRCIVAAEHLRALMGIANQRFAENQKRIDRFREAFRKALDPPAKKRADGGDWEDPAARRERKRAEGLLRRADLEKRAGETGVSSD